MKTEGRKYTKINATKRKDTKRKEKNRNDTKIK